MPTKPSFDTTQKAFFRFVEGNKNLYCSIAYDKPQRRPTSYYLINSLVISHIDQSLLRKLPLDQFRIIPHVCRDAKDSSPKFFKHHLPSNKTADRSCYYRCLALRNALQPRALYHVSPIQQKKRQSQGRLTFRFNSGTRPCSRGHRFFLHRGR